MISHRFVVPPLLVISAVLDAIGATPTSITLSSSVNPSVFGQPVILTATLTPAGATGTVTFYDGTTIIGIKSLAAGHAALSISLLASGVRSLKAYYAGDSTYTPSTSPLLAQMISAVPSNGFQTALTYAAGNQPNVVAVGDFNADGKADLAIADIQGINILLGNGDGTFQVAKHYPTVVGPASVVVGDFNGDGRTDLAVAYLVGSTRYTVAGTYRPH